MRWHSQQRVLPFIVLIKRLEALMNRRAGQANIAAKPFLIRNTHHHSHSIRHFINIFSKNKTANFLYVVAINNLQ